MAILDAVAALGAFALRQLFFLGRFGVFLLLTLRGFAIPPRKYWHVMKQVHFIGTKSFFVICFTGAFSGMVLGLQGYYTLSKFGAEGVLGAGIALTLIRELGPVLAALMVAGRAGSAMCAELGIMRIEEQIDALECMAIDPHAYLTTPRLAAALIALPLLTAFLDVVGIGGGYLIGVNLLGGNPGAYLSGIEDNVDWFDVRMGIIKSFVFAVIIVWICTYKGFYAGVDSGSYGPEQVGRATTDAVVLASVSVLVADYVATSILV